MQNGVSHQVTRIPNSAQHLNSVNVKPQIILWYVKYFILNRTLTRQLENLIAVQKYNEYYIEDRSYHYGVERNEMRSVRTQ